MNESGHTAAFAKLLPESIYSLKVSLRRGCKTGVADAWYSGDANDLWIEWKVIKTNPRKLSPESLLSESQRKWCVERRQQGRNVIVAIVTPLGIVVFDPLDLSPIDRSSVESRVLSRQELSAAGAAFLTGEDHEPRVASFAAFLAACGAVPGNSVSDQDEPDVGAAAFAGHHYRGPGGLFCNRSRAAGSAPHRPGDLLPCPRRNQALRPPAARRTGLPAQAAVPVTPGARVRKRAVPGRDETTQKIVAQA